MAGVTFDPAVGGNGSTVTDDANPSTGLDGGGHRTRFVPALAQIVAIAVRTLQNATAAAASAASALNAPGTSATSASTIAMGVGNVNLVLVQQNKAFTVGQSVVIASQANASNQMVGVITAFNAATGAMTVAVALIEGSGTYSGWNVALTASGNASILPDTRLPTRLRQRGSFAADLNTALDSGYYYADQSSNAPTTGPWLIHVQRFGDVNGTWIIQTAQAFLGGTLAAYGNVTTIRRREWNASIGWGAWREVPTTRADLDALYAGDNGLPARLLATGGEQVTDWNNVKKNGMFVGFPAPNNPTQVNSPDNSQFWIGRVEVWGDANWVVQRVWNVTQSSDTGGEVAATWVRKFINGTWTTWRHSPGNLLDLTNYFFRTDGSNAFRGLKETRANAVNHTLDLTAYSVVNVVNLGSGTFALANMDANAAVSQSITLHIYNGGSFTYTWPVTEWANGSPPVLGVNAWDTITLIRFWDNAQWKVFGYHSRMRG